MLLIKNIALHKYAMDQSLPPADTKNVTGQCGN